MPNRVRVLAVPDADRAGLAGLEDAPRPGGPRRAKGISVSHASISALWRKVCLHPHRTEGLKFSTGPQLEARVRDVVGLYLDPRTTTRGRSPGPRTPTRSSPR